MKLKELQIEELMVYFQNLRSTPKDWKVLQKNYPMK